MSIVINSINHLVLTIQKAIMPNAIAGDNSNLVATSAHTRSYMSSVGKIFNDGYTYTVTTLKTIPTLILAGHTLTTGCASTTNTMTIGTILATQVNIGTSSTPSTSFYVAGTQQHLQPAGTNGYSIPAISGSNNSKIQAGIVTASDTGTTVIYTVPYSGAPHIGATSKGTTPKLVTLYQPAGVNTSQGFGIAVQGGGDACWVSSGPK